jgi:hypothetical protein
MLHQLPAQDCTTETVPTGPARPPVPSTPTMPRALILAAAALYLTCASAQTTLPPPASAPPPGTTLPPDATAPSLTTLPPSTATTCTKPDDIAQVPTLPPGSACKVPDFKGTCFGPADDGTTVQTAEDKQAPSYQDLDIKIQLLEAEIVALKEQTSWATGVLDAFESQGVDEFGNRRPVVFYKVNWDLLKAAVERAYPPDFQPFQPGSGARWIAETVRERARRPSSQQTVLRDDAWEAASVISDRPAPSSLDPPVSPQPLHSSWPRPCLRPNTSIVSRRSHCLRMVLTRLRRAVHVGSDCAHSPPPVRPV